MQLNQQSRLYYDGDAQSAAESNSEKTLKWYTDDSQRNLAISHPNIYDVDVVNTLFTSFATRSTSKDDVNTEMWGTSPFLGRLPDGKMIGKTDTESELMFGMVNSVTQCSNKQVHEPNYQPHMPIIQVERIRGGISTRNDSIQYNCNK
jgi:hypothetical protein